MKKTKIVFAFLVAPTYSMDHMHLTGLASSLAGITDRVLSRHSQERDPRMLGLPKPNSVATILNSLLTTLAEKGTAITPLSLSLQRLIILKQESLLGQPEISEVLRKKLVELNGDASSRASDTMRRELGRIGLAINSLGLRAKFEEFFRETIENQLKPLLQRPPTKEEIAGHLTRPSIKNHLEWQWEKAQREEEQTIIAFLKRPLCQS